MGIAAALHRGILPRVGPRAIRGPLFRNTHGPSSLSRRPSGGGEEQQQKQLQKHRPLGISEVCVLMACGGEQAKGEGRPLTRHAAWPDRTPGARRRAGLARGPDWGQDAPTEGRSHTP